MKIQLLHFQGCPNAAAARASLCAALAAEQLDASIEEIDVEDPAAPGWARGWGSPTILIDGTDLLGQHPPRGPRGACAPAARPASLSFARGSRRRKENA